MEPVQLAAILMGATLLASMVSVQIGVSVSLIELAFGIGPGERVRPQPESELAGADRELRLSGPHVPRRS
jgi:hypothetical protein